MISFIFRFGQTKTKLSESSVKSFTPFILIVPHYYITYSFILNYITLSLLPPPRLNVERSHLESVRWYKHRNLISRQHVDITFRQLFILDSFIVLFLVFFIRLDGRWVCFDYWICVLNIFFFILFTILDIYCSSAVVLGVCFHFLFLIVIFFFLISVFLYRIIFLY